MVDKANNPIPVPIVSIRSSLENKTGTWKNAYPLRQELLAPCCQACPVGNDIPRFIQAIAEDRFSEALAVLREETPFPGITARACSRFCMVPCNKKEIDDKKRISIAELEQAAADYGTPELPIIRSTNGYKVAVIGAGPAGLTASYFLAWLGYQVTILDAEDKPGGKLWTDGRYRRVPEKVLEKELKLILELVDFLPKARLGANLNWKDLEEYKAIFLAIDEDQLPALAEFELLEGLNIALGHTPARNSLIAFSPPDLDVKRWMITYAIRAGKRAAIAIDQAIKKESRNPSEFSLGPDGGISFIRYLEGHPSYVSNEVADVDHINQDTMSSRFAHEYPPPTSENNLVVESGLSRQEAVAEAQRCLSCGVCNLCGVCVMSCPDMAVMEIDGEIEFNYDYCKGCAICVEECPRGALRLEIDR